MIDQNVSYSTIKVLAAEAILKYPTESLLPMLTDDDPVVRTLVARELQARGGQDVFSHVSEVVTSKRFEHREIAAFVLGQLGTPKFPFREQSIPILRTLLLDDYYEVQGAAIAALGHLKVSEMLPDIMEFALSAEDYIKENVAFTLSFLDLNKMAIKVLKKLKLDNNPDIRDWAEFALSEHRMRIKNAPQS